MAHENTPHFRVEKDTGERPWKIVDREGKEVGRSDTEEKALRSVGYRTAAVEKKEQG